MRLLRPACLALTLLCLMPAMALAGIVSARVWPAEDYTRITLESKRQIPHKLFTIQNPERLVIDLQGEVLDAKLKALPGLLSADDPYIQGIRVGQYKPDVVRLVLDLKREAAPQLFELAPVKDYGHRLVLDVYPRTPPDPLLALLDPADIATAVPAPPVPAAQPALTLDTLKSAPDTPSATPPAASVQAPPQRTAIPELRARMLIIAIDAGHGGEDPGARGRKGSLEKNVTLTIARKLKKQVDATPGLRGVLIRDGDYFIPLGTRVAKARKAHADLFVSIHADAFIKSTARGSSVFALSERGATSSAARWLAKKENEADLIGGVNIAVKDPYLARTLLDLSLTATINDSLKLAKHVLNELGDINDLHRGHVEQAGFAVLKSPDIPSILVETAFISNPQEESRLNDNTYQDKLSGAILSGIQRYFSQNPAIARKDLARAAY